MTRHLLLGGPGFARGARWAVAIAIALLLLVAAEMRTAPGLGGSRATRDLLRVLIAALCLIGAFVARRWEARSEAAGFLVAGLAVLASAGIDAAVVRWASGGGGAPDVERRLLAGRIAGSLVALGGSVALGVRLMRISVADLTGAPARWPKTLALAFALGLVTYPLLSLANTYGNEAIDQVLASGTPSLTSPWPRFHEVVFHREPFPEASSFLFTGIALRLVITLPLMEVLLHGVLRQAFGRWGAIPFVVGTAFLAPFLLMEQQMSFALFAGAIATGLFAARTASLFPALAYWTAIFTAQALAYAIR